MTDSEFSKALKDFHKNSDRHILVSETDMPYSDVLKVVSLSNRIRKAGNELTAIMRKRYSQLRRTKRYRKLLSLYRNTDNKTKRTTLAKQLNKMQKDFNVTWEFCRKSMIPIGKKYNISSVLALTKAEDVWRGLEKCLYGNGKLIRFSKYGELPCLRAKQYNKEIILSAKEGTLSAKLGKTKFGLKIKDKFQQDEVAAVLNYLANSEEIDRRAAQILHDTGEIIDDTYRPCYATLVPKKIRGKYRIYLHLTIEGKAKPKYKRNGEPRHYYGHGKIGADIGTQTVAYTSFHEVRLQNLAERAINVIKKSERQERLIHRKMGQSRRATNPQNYNTDGTVRKGKKTWTYSKRYRRLRDKYSNLSRKNSVNRQLAINTDANYLRSIGDELVTEPKNASKLMRRAKETTKNAKGKFNRKKRFGKSIRNRCPGSFQSTVAKKFKETGGIYYEVPNNYRASQYDHTADTYIKKKLSDRMYKLSDGTDVQRDWYSSFLLYCYDPRTQSIDKAKCKAEFSYLLKQEKALIEWIKTNKIKILNSGIKVA